MKAKMDRGRPVFVKYRDNDGAEQESAATFHVWGYRITRPEAAGQRYMESRAVVELPSGLCRWVNPTHVQFTDREQ